MDETQLRNLEFDVHQDDVWSHPGQSLLGGPPSRTVSNPVVPQRLSTVGTQNQQNQSHSLSLSNPFTTASLQNPSDAIDILAQVGNSTEDAAPSESEAEGSQNESRPARSAVSFAHGSRPLRTSSTMEVSFDYKPVLKGLISYETVFALFARFVGLLRPPPGIAADNPLKL
jgi:hypothetical protein